MKIFEKFPYWKNFAILLFGGYGTDTIIFW